MSGFISREGACECLARMCILQRSVCAAKPLTDLAFLSFIAVQELNRMRKLVYPRNVYFLGLASSCSLQ